MPLRAQWARAFTKEYRNYGHTTTSPCESLHASVKSLLRNASQNLQQLFHALKLQRDHLHANFEERISKEGRRIRDEFRHILLSDVTELVSWKALSLVHEQYCKAKGSKLRPNDYPIGTCSGAFHRQLGLPCRHTIFEDYLRIEGVGNDREVITLRPLEITWFDNQWVIRTDLVGILDLK